VELSNFNTLKRNGFAEQRCGSDTCCSTLSASQQANLKKADHKRRGYLFQNRYKSIVLQKNSYLKELVGKRTCGFQGGRLILSCVTKSVSSGKKPDMRDYVNQVLIRCENRLSMLKSCKTSYARSERMSAMAGFLMDKVTSDQRLSHIMCYFMFKSQ
jgi:hypothetical protein